MDRIIHKTPLFDVPGTWDIVIPGIDPKVLSMDDGFAWYEFTPLAQKKTHIDFLIAYTGVIFELPNRFEFVGTCRLPPLVVHLYWRTTV